MDENKKKTPHPESVADPDGLSQMFGELDESVGEMNLDELLEDAREYADMEPLQPAEEAPRPFLDEEYRDTFGEGEELRSMFSEDGSMQPLETDPEPDANEPQEQQEETAGSAEKEELSMRKGRPKRKDQYGMLGIPHILVTCFWLIIVIAIGVSMGRVIWVCASDVLAFGREEKIVNVQIDNDDTLEEIAQKLHEGGLIRYPGLFKIYASFTDAREEIGSGNFALNTLYDYHALVNSMNGYYTSGEEVTVLIPEGYTCAQIFALLEEQGVCSAEELENYAKDGELEDYWFLENANRGDKYSLEGFLFPDTYEFYANSSAKRVLGKMLDNFDKRFTEEMRESVDSLNEYLASRMRNNGYSEEYIEEHKMSVRDVVTVASLIEKETAGSEESPNIASVIYNRLTNEDEWPYLNIDAALLYAIGHREEISADDKQTDTPYNTYLYPGLIPGPIANPGLNSLKAALDPNDTDYYCYALDPEAGAHHFSTTLEEHNAFLESLGE